MPEHVIIRLAAEYKNALENEGLVLPGTHRLRLFPRGDGTCELHMMQERRDA